MSENINYRKKVNQQLAGAAFQLSLLQDRSLNLSPLQETSCRQCALHHLYVSFNFYINEVLNIYKRERLDFSYQPLATLFTNNRLKDYSIIEFNELQQWYDKDHSLLADLITLDQLLQQDDEKKATEKRQEKDLIAVMVVDEDLSVLVDTQKIVMLKNELSSLIDRQRESLLEH